MLDHNMDETTRVLTEMGYRVSDVGWGGISYDPSRGHTVVTTTTTTPATPAPATTWREMCEQSTHAARVDLNERIIRPSRRGCHRALDDLQRACQSIATELGYDDADKLLRGRKYPEISGSLRDAVSCIRHAAERLSMLEARIKY
jgi:hypothetical protein